MLFVSLISGCGGGSSDGTQTDSVAPVITILGNNPSTVNQGTAYNDAGATATDNVDGTVGVVVTGAVNTAVVGTYTLTYTATDAAGNTASSTRTVNVVSVGTSSHSVQGVIRDYATGAGLPGVTVSVGSNSATTAANGGYSVPVDDALTGDVVVTVAGPGIATTGSVVTIPTAAGANAALTVDTLPVAFTATFNPNQGFTAAVPNSPANVVIGAGTLVDANGVPPVGNVTVNVTPIDPAVNISLMPGTLADGAGVPIESYGAMTVEFTDASGNKLNLGSGQTSTIRIPVSNKDATTAPPATMPLFFYDEEQGFWVQEGTGTLSADSTYYEGTVGHFTTWNVDDYFISIRIMGCVQDINGNKLPNALVKLEGFNYNGRTSTRTNANGDFTISAMQNRVSILVASLSNKESNTLKIGENESTATDITLTECLVIGDAPLTARLTWGENPRDLDTHVYGPNNYHIYFSNKGSLTSGEMAQLDVDDQQSYGPEVYTALSFPQAGTYHYAIHHWAGTSTISASPARVELNLEGNTTVFSPPAGQGANDEWWNVFDIIVDASGNISITPINTWSTTSPSTSGRPARMVK